MILKGYSKDWNENRENVKGSMRIKAEKIMIYYLKKTIISILHYL